MSSGVAGARNKRTSGGKKPGGGASILKMVKQNQERADLIGAVNDQREGEGIVRRADGLAGRGALVRLYPDPGSGRQEAITTMQLTAQEKRDTLEPTFITCN